MTPQEARNKLYSDAFLLGGLFRKSAIKALVSDPDPGGVVVLAEALEKGGHPDAEYIKATLLHLGAGQGDAANAERIRALWRHWVQQPSEALSPLLDRLGWPAGQAADTVLNNTALKLIDPKAQPGLQHTVAMFLRAQPVEAEALNDAIYRTWIASQSTELENLLEQQARRPSAAGVLALAEALGKGHALKDKLAARLRTLSPRTDAAKLHALWLDWQKTASAPVGAVLADLGWPEGVVLDEGTVRTILGKTNAVTPENNLRAILCIARLLPNDDANNDSLYAAWIASLSPRFAALLEEQGREPSAASVIALARASANSTDPFAARLRQLSPVNDADKLHKLWREWTTSPNQSIGQDAVGAVLADLGWPEGVVLDEATARTILGRANTSTPENNLRAILCIARLLPNDEPSNDLLYGAWIASRSPLFAALFNEQGREPSVAAVLDLASAIISNYKDPFAARIRQLSPVTDAEKLHGLWMAWAANRGKTGSAYVGAILADLGWPESYPLDDATTQAILSRAHGNADPANLRAVVRYARLLPVNPATTSALYRAWAQSGADDIGVLIDPQLRPPSVEDVLALAEALGSSPSAVAFSAALRRLSPETEAAHIHALWQAWFKKTTPVLAAILADLGWPPGQTLDPAIPRNLLVSMANQTAPDIIRAALRLVDLLPADDALTEALYRALLNTGAEPLGTYIQQHGLRPNPANVQLMADKVAAGAGQQFIPLLKSLDTASEAEQIHILWQAWIGMNTAPDLATLLTDLGWPAAVAVDEKTQREILAKAVANASPETFQVIARFVRDRPIQDETLNDALYGAWLRSQSDVLEKLIAEQGRQPGSPALEALHALATSKLERYAALQDEDGKLLVQAYQMAPEPFRKRIAQTVAASPDRKLKAAYRLALGSSGTEVGQSVDNLKRVGDEDGLFAALRHLRLSQALELCERWAKEPGRPDDPRQREAVDRAVAAWGKLGSFKLEAGPKLPLGLVDIFEWWRKQNPNDAQLRANLNAEDPFDQAGALYLGHERGLVDANRLRTAALSRHWPSRMIARLLDPSLLANAKEDHVLWVNAMAGDASVLTATIAGTPEDYARHTDQLTKAAGPAAARTRTLLEILCALQGIFVASGITVDESAEPAETTAAEVEDAPEIEF